MTRIVTTHYSYKRPPRRKQPVALEGPEVVTVPDRKRRRATVRVKPADEQTPAPANVSHRSSPTLAASKPAIVTAHRPGKRYADVPDMTPEEHQRRVDAANAMMREMKRRIAEKARKS